jgi:AraC-like DNA-binding protein
MKMDETRGRATRRDWIRRSHDQLGFERIEAFFEGYGYALHRHDTYAIGTTLAGVQSFTYRNDRVHSLPGHTMVIHPDEPHDGEAGTPEGFLYRIAYIDPALLQQALGEVSLPFLKTGVSTDPRLYTAVQAILANIDIEYGVMERDDLLLDLAIALQSAANLHKSRRHCGDFRAAQLAREYINDSLTRTITLDELASVSGRDRWSLSRDFRKYFGTSPYRYLTMRRLDLARRMMLAGEPLAACSTTAGFADQSHMTRQFVQTYGLPPARWVKIVRST